jgi:alanine racemase
VGYADGIDRRLGNRNAYFLVNGTKCPTIGNICMDLCMIDITDCPDIGDGSVEIFGTDAPIERLAETLGTIPYEVLTSVSPRVKRVYYRE